MLKSEEGKIQPPKTTLKSRFAHVIVDVTKYFCCSYKYIGIGNDDTEKVAKKISALAPKFKKAGALPYWIYTSDHTHTPKAFYANFYIAEPEKDDSLAVKTTSSAFETSDIDEQLSQAEITTLVISGVNLTACVKETAIDARENGYNVWVLNDCTANNSSCHKEGSEGWQKHIDDIKAAGIEIISSTEALKRIATHNQPASKNTLSPALI